jgi:hypothetical protein
VIFEAGMALGMAPDRTILVMLGSDVELFSDLGGRHIIRLDNRPSNKNFLRDKLQSVGCTVDMKTSHHLDSRRGGDFEACVRPPEGEFTPRSPFPSGESPTRGDEESATIEFLSRLEGRGDPMLPSIVSWQRRWEVVLVNRTTDRTLRDVHVNLTFSGPEFFFQRPGDHGNWKGRDNPLLVSVTVSAPVHPGERVPLGMLHYGDPRQGVAHARQESKGIGWTVGAESSPPSRGSEDLEVGTPS